MWKIEDREQEGWEEGKKGDGEGRRKGSSGVGRVHGEGR